MFSDTQTIFNMTRYVWKRPFQLLEYKGFICWCNSKYDYEWVKKKQGCNLLWYKHYKILLLLGNPPLQVCK